MKVSTIAAAGGLALLALPALGQPAAPPQVCKENPEFAQFDFWVGEWDVYSTDGKDAFQGHNSIQKLDKGCLVLEHWTSPGGGEGHSINYYDPIDTHWRQVWVSPNLSIDYTGGLDEGGRMVLVGTIHYYNGGKTFPFRGIWTPNADGTVLQHFDQQDPASGEWSVWFEGLYKPAAPAAGE
jgi:hypothetical protein